MAPNRTIAVLGATGMLGHKLFQVLRERFPGTVALVREQADSPAITRVPFLRGTDVIGGVDATDFNSLRRTLDALRPDVIINAIGIVKQREEASNAVLSITINSLLPHWLADAAASWGGRVMHFSTDCVFSGRRGNYDVSDNSDAEDLYGRSKFLGEVTASNALTLRTSIIGRELREYRSLVEWFLSQKGKSVRGFSKVIYSGMTTIEMANVVTMLLQRFPDLSGPYQVASKPITKYDLLRLIRDAYTVDIEITPDDREVSDRSMVGTKFREATGYVAPEWPVMVREMAADPTRYDEWGARV